MKVVWEDPPGWKRLPVTSAMRKATYRAPRAEGDKEEPELSVFYFGPSQGGGVEANITRWVSQFPGTKPDAVHREDRSANGLTQHVVAIDHGAFTSGMPGDQATMKDAFALLGAIVEAPSGSYFFKLVGPEASVKAARAAFYHLLDSVKPSS